MSQQKGGRDERSLVLLQQSDKASEHDTSDPQQVLVLLKHG